MTADETIALAYNALAHPRRARLFRLLSIEPEAGRSFGSLLLATGFAKAALKHHIDVMEKGGLIRRRRHGNFVAFVLTPGSLSSAMAQVQRLGRVTQNADFDA